MNTLIRKIQKLYNGINEKNVQKTLYYLTDISESPKYRKLLDTALITKGLMYAPSELILLKNKLTTQKAATDKEAAKVTQKTINYLKKSKKCYVYFNDYYKHVEVTDAKSAIKLLITKLSNNDEF